MPKKQQKMASNQKMQENKPTLKFNFTWEYMWPVLILGIFCSDGPIQRALLDSNPTTRRNYSKVKGSFVHFFNYFVGWKEFQVNQENPQSQS